MPQDGVQSLYDDTPQIIYGMATAEAIQISLESCYTIESTSPQQLWPSIILAPF